MKKMRPIRIDGDIAYVSLTKGFEAIIDAQDVPLVGQYNWYVEVRKYTAYALRNAPRGTGAGRKIIRLHRELLGQPSLDVDHIDCNGLNNRRSNLRLATHAQNLCNRGAPEVNTSGHKGVGWHKSSGKWRAVITVNGKQKHVGSFHDKHLAVSAYADACKRVHGEFGRTS